MMTCGRCSLPLPPGSSHATPESCIEALRSAYVTARTCQHCLLAVDPVLHPTCSVKSGGGKVVDYGVDAAKRRVTQAAVDFLFGGGEKKVERESRGKRFEP